VAGQVVDLVGLLGRCALAVDLAAGPLLGVIVFLLIRRASERRGLAGRSSVTYRPTAIGESPRDGP